MSSASYNYYIILLTYISETEIEQPRVHAPRSFIMDLSLIHSTHPAKKGGTLNLTGSYPTGQDIASYY